MSAGQVFMLALLIGLVVVTTGIAIWDSRHGAPTIDADIESEIRS